MLFDSSENHSILQICFSSHGRHICSILICLLLIWSWTRRVSPWAYRHQWSGLTHTWNTLMVAPLNWSNSWIAHKELCPLLEKLSSSTWRLVRAAAHQSKCERVGSCWGRVYRWIQELPIHCFWAGSWLYHQECSLVFVLVIGFGGRVLSSWCLGNGRRLWDFRSQALLKGGPMGLRHHAVVAAGLSWRDCLLCHLTCQVLQLYKCLAAVSCCSNQWMLKHYFSQEWITQV